MQGKSGFGRDRQLLVACDAMEWNLVDDWARAGYLPTFRHLIEQGSRAILSTTAAQLPDTVWGSICTGCNPAKFEKYFYVQYDPDTQGLRHVRDDAIRRPPFWDYLTKAGRKVCAVDVPKFPISLRPQVSWFRLMQNSDVIRWGIATG
jgi:predicted AlkP superfamily phosphohydrolase/phosphomutase